MKNQLGVLILDKEDWLLPENGPGTTSAVIGKNAGYGGGFGHGGGIGEGLGDGSSDGHGYGFGSGLNGHGRRSARHG